MQPAVQALWYNAELETVQGLPKFDKIEIFRQVYNIKSATRTDYPNLKSNIPSGKIQYIKKT